MTVRFALDEVAAFGQAPQALKDAVALGRGYGLETCWILQGLGQLKTLLPEDGGQTLLANTAQVFFGVNDQETAEYISKRLGEATIVVESGGTGTSRSWQSSGGKESTTCSRNTNSNWQQVGRSLLKIDEVLSLSPREAISFVPGMRPIRTQLLRYYEEKLTRKKWFGEGAAATRMFFMSLAMVVASYVWLMFALSVTSK
jgi:type IV secretion system protein VirD4